MRQKKSFQYTPAQVAEMLCTSTLTVRSYLSRGLLPYEQSGKNCAIHIRHADVVAFQLKRNERLFEALLPEVRADLARRWGYLTEQR